MTIEILIKSTDGEKWVKADIRGNKEDVKRFVNELMVNFNDLMIRTEGDAK